MAFYSSEDRKRGSYEPWDDKGSKCYKINVDLRLLTLENMDLTKFSLYVFSSFFIFYQVGGGKLLVVPMDGSHWLSMRLVVEKLMQNGHDVVVVMPESSLTMGGSEKYTILTFPVPYTSQEISANFQKLSKEHFTLPSHFPWIATAMLDSMMVVFNKFYQTCESLLLNQQLIQKLRDEKFDAIHFLLCGVILAEHLDLPNVNFLRGLPCGYDYDSAQCETPLSYVPRLFSKFSDKMTFIERVKNLMIKLLEPYYCGVIYSSWMRLATELLKKDIAPVQLFSRTSVWLLRYDFVFEYPKTLMPNMVFIGGINCRLQKSLPNFSASDNYSSSTEAVPTFVDGSLLWCTTSTGTFVSHIGIDGTKRTLYEQTLKVSVILDLLVLFNLWNS
ncbi:unnamed protein product [Ranitomeya imitator]|uniref:Uncharacterized protein n=1 Tax=Ranitomeya imitator TaxID=111125 RepID=A0ABN9MF42_9NEOB|nr:unnamed protein product [Ranitomeya imitator]